MHYRLLGLFFLLSCSISFSQELTLTEIQQIETALTNSKIQLQQQEILIMNLKEIQKTDNELQMKLNSIIGAQSTELTKLSVSLKEQKKETVINKLIIFGQGVLLGATTVTIIYLVNK